MEVKQLFNRAVSQATLVVEQVQPPHLHQPTPCTEWDVQTLLGHMLYELSWVPDVVTGATIAEVGDRYDGDLLGDNLSRSWHRAAEAALRAVEACDLGATAHLSYGHVTNEAYLRQESGEQLIHSWDLSVGIGHPVHFDPEVAGAVYGDTLPQAESMRSSGLFAPQVPLPADADVETRLLSLFGRARSRS